MRETNNITPSELGLSCPIEDQAWYLIQSESPREALVDVVDTLTGIERSHQIVPAASPNALLRSEPSTAACLPTGMESWGDPDYADLDRLRADVREAWPVLIWVASASSVERLVHLAPNFADFFQPSAGLWSDGAMSSQQAEVHLEELRARWGQTDDEVVALASSGKLRQDVDHHLWLVLLGRGDLIDKTSSGLK